MSAFCARVVEILHADKSETPLDACALTATLAGLLADCVSSSTRAPAVAITGAILALVYVESTRSERAPVIHNILNTCSEMLYDVIACMDCEGLRDNPELQHNCTKILMVFSCRSLGRRLISTSCSALTALCRAMVAHPSECAEAGFSIIANFATCTDGDVVDEATGMRVFTTANALHLLTAGVIPALRAAPFADALHNRACTMFEALINNARDEFPIDDTTKGDQEAQLCEAIASLCDIIVPVLQHCLTAMADNAALVRNACAFLERLMRRVKEYSIGSVIATVRADSLLTLMSLHSSDKRLVESCLYLVWTLVFAKQPFDVKSSGVFDVVLAAVQRHEDMAVVETASGFLRDLVLLHPDAAPLFLQCHGVQCTLEHIIRPAVAATFQIRPPQRPPRPTVPRTQARLREADTPATTAVNGIQLLTAVVRSFASGSVTVMDGPSGFEDCFVESLAVLCRSHLPRSTLLPNGHANITRVDAAAMQLLKELVACNTDAAAALFVGDGAHHMSSFLKRLRQIPSEADQAQFDISSPEDCTLKHIEALQHTVCELLVALSANRPFGKKFVTLSGFTLLHAVLGSFSQNRAVVANVCQALSNLIHENGAHQQQLYAFTALRDRVLCILATQTDSAAVQRSCCGIVWGLACYSEAKAWLVSNGVAELVMAAGVAFPDDALLQQWANIALSLLIERPAPLAALSSAPALASTDVDAALDSFCEDGGIDIGVDLAMLLAEDYDSTPAASEGTGATGRAADGNSGAAGPSSGV